MKFVHAIRARSVVQLSAASILALMISSTAHAQTVLSVWDGRTNLWESVINWQHSPPSVLGYPSNGIQTYDVNISSGQVTSDQPITINSLTLNGGRVVIDQPLTLRSNLFWNGGDFDGLSALVVEGNLSIIGSEARTFPKTVRSYGDSLLDGPSLISGPDEEFNSARWQNFGALEWRGACLVSNFYQFVNYGTFTKTGAGELTFPKYSHLNSHGDLKVQEGSLRIHYDGYFSGRVSVDTGATLVVNDWWLAESNTIVSGPGTIRIEAGPEDYMAHFGAGSGGVTVLSNLTVEIGNNGNLGDFYSFATGTNLGGLVIGPDVNVVMKATDLGGAISGPQTTNYGSMLIQAPCLTAFQNYGTMEVQGNLTLNVGGLQNRGVIRKTGTDKVSFQPTSLFTNYGTIDVQGGTLSLGFGGASSGTLNARPGATNIIGGYLAYAFTLLEGTRLVGGGFHEGSSVKIVGVITNEGDFFPEAVDYQSTGTIYNATGAILRLGSTTCRVVNDGSVISATNNGTVSTLLNYGTLQLDSGALDGFVNNNGQILKTQSNAFVFSGTLINGNVLNVLSGALFISGSVTNAGTISGEGWLSVTNSGRLTINATTTNLAPTRIDGVLDLRSNLTVTKTLVLTNYPSDSPGTVLGPGDLIVASNATATARGGNISGPGVWRIAQGGEFRLTPNQYWEPGTFTRDIENDGVMRLTGILKAPGATFVNRGVAYTSGGIITTGYLPVTLINQGTWIVPSNSTFGFIDPTTRFTNGGSFIVDGRVTAPISYHQSLPIYGPGHVVLEGGMLSGTFFIPNGTLSGYGTNDEEIVSYGVIHPTRELRISSLVLGSGARVRFDLGGTNAGIDYPRMINSFIRFSNNVTFDVRLTNAFMPKVGDAFEVMKFQWYPLIGTNGFAIYPRLTGLNLPNGLRLAPILTSTSLTFVAVAPPSNGQAQLRIQRAWFGTYQLYWPPECAGLFIQYTTNLLSPWTTITLSDFNPPLYVGSGPVKFFWFADPSVDDSQ